MSQSNTASAKLAPPTAWSRFRRNPAAKIGAIVLGLLALASLLALPFSLRWFDVQSLDIAVRHAPSITPVISLKRFLALSQPSPADKRSSTASPDVHSSSTNSPSSPWGEGRGEGLSHEPTKSPFETQVSPLTRAAYRMSSLFGHDNLGRSLFYRASLGFIISGLIGLAAALMAVIMGGLWGSIAGLVGGRVDWLMMRIVDVLYGLPYILMVILMRVALAPPLTKLFGQQTRYANIVILLLAIGSVSWLTMARVVRGQVLSLKSQLFVEAARVSGASTLHIIRRHILPNLVGPLTVYATLVVPQAILQEAFLSFLGIGIQQPVPSLGRLAADGVQAVNTFVGFWWLIAFPCGILVITLLALNFLGDGLRDAFDPKSQASTLL